jgi:hypothetical protein
MLRLDFCLPPSLCRAMPDHLNDTAHLIQQLLLEAGRIMEDCSPEFALALPPDGEEIAARLTALEGAVRDLAALAAAARALQRLDLSND